MLPLKPQKENNSGTLCAIIRDKVLQDHALFSPRPQGFSSLSGLLQGDPRVHLRHCASSAFLCCPFWAVKGILLRHVSLRAMRLEGQWGFSGLQRSAPFSQVLLCGCRKSKPTALSKVHPSLPTKESLLCHPLVIPEGRRRQGRTSTSLIKEL